ncbi:hypothetical protein KIPB_007006, partial [Kipferlia bialata]|eukprot:g7006.t1
MEDLLFLHCGLSALET